MPVWVGTSGWQYAWWRGVFYPTGLPQRRWLEHYAAILPTVENNSAFYRLPKRATFEAWRVRIPIGFLMAVKASRYLTHIRRLRDPEEPVRRFLGVVAGLGDRLGPVLIQLPPTLQADPARLDETLALFPGGVRVAVEPRHDSWWTDEIRGVLAARGAALCWADVRGRPRTPLWRTAGWGYVRFHQGAARPWPSYGEQSLRSWVERIADTWPDTADVFAYFNNDPDGAAVRDAQRFADLVKKRRGRSSPGPPTPFVPVDHRGVSRS